jgi:Txe/YoeB family toxin of Txe-Axe toxin-antitoxin module
VGKQKEIQERECMWNESQSKKMKTHQNNSKTKHHKTTQNKITNMINIKHNTPARIERTQEKLLQHTSKLST